jgi:hypothetical protein
MARVALGGHPPSAPLHQAGWDVGASTCAFGDAMGHCQIQSLGARFRPESVEKQPSAAASLAWATPTRCAPIQYLPGELDNATPHPCS